MIINDLKMYLSGLPELYTQLIPQPTHYSIHCKHNYKMLNYNVLYNLVVKKFGIYNYYHYLCRHKYGVQKGVPFNTQLYIWL